MSDNDPEPAFELIPPRPSATRPRACAEAILSSRVVAIIREPTAAEALAEARRLVAAGVEVMEVSLSTPDAIGVVRRLHEEVGPSALHLGVGTVLSRSSVQEAARAGASFVVSPIYESEVISTCKSLDLITIAGVMTPTECVAAVSAGVEFLKLFPARNWSPKSLEDLLQGLPFLQLVPTGGVSLADARAWLDAGAVAVGVGGGLRAQQSGDGLATDLRRLAVGPRRTR